MQPRLTKKESKNNKFAPSSGLSEGVMHLNGKTQDRQPSKFLDFLVQTFLFVLGAVILCAMLYALVLFT